MGDILKKVDGAITFNANTLFFYMKTDAGYAVELVIICAFCESLIFCSTLETFLPLEQKRSVCR